MELGIEGKLALVTGSTLGIGAAIAKGLAAEGARVIVNGRSPARVDQAVAKMRREGADAVGVAADLGTAEGCQALLEGAAAIGEVDILVNNTGIWEDKPFAELTDDDWRTIFDVNVMSGVRVTRALLPGMLERKRGRVLFIASEAGVKVIPTMIHYATTKTCYVTIARGLAELTRGTEVTVNSLVVGPTKTDGAMDYISKIGDLAEMETAYFQGDARSSILGRFATPREVADVAVFLCSARSGNINGAAQRCEGGIVRSLF